MKCSVWKKVSRSSGSSQFVSECGGGVELQARPEDWTRPKGPTSYIVTYQGRIVRHGYAKTMRAARSAARRQAGAKAGVP